MTERAPKQKVPESGVLKACLDLLAAERIWHMRMNTGAMQIGKRFTRFGRPGIADILAIPILPYRCGCCTDRHSVTALHPVWIECKSNIGKQSLAQKEFQQECKENSHTYLLVREVDELRSWLKERKELR